MRFVYALLTWVVIGVGGIAAFAYSGLYPVGADVPHWKVTEHFIAWARNHAIDRSAVGLNLPPLDDPALIKLGAEHYAEMCVACHMAPGVKQSSELRQGLYPRPPDLTRFAPTPDYAYWVIKHGLKMTAMPAWGKTHTDHEILAMVAFLQKQPKMSAAEFKALTADAAQVEMGAKVAPAPAATGAPAANAQAPARVAAPGAK